STALWVPPLPAPVQVTAPTKQRQRPVAPRRTRSVLPLSPAAAAAVVVPPLPVRTVRRVVLPPRRPRQSQPLTPLPTSPAVLTGVSSARSRLVKLVARRRSPVQVPSYLPPGVVSAPRPRRVL